MAESSTDSGESHDSDHGYFLGSDDSDDDFEVIEDPEKYQSGLFFPVCIGDYITDRYRIVHKLGYGAFSTVWLARDITAKKDVALKIMIPGDAAEHEIQVQNEIKQHVKDVSKLVLYLDAFLIRDSNDCNHRVLVFPFRGPSLGSILGLRHNIPRATRVLAAKQVLEAVGSLHEAGFIHGDINDMNVMWGLPPLDHHDTAAKYKLLGRPQKKTLPLQQHAEHVAAIQFPISLLTDKVYLGDFGLTTSKNIHGMEGWQPPRVYCAPEVRHRFKPSFASDMWSYTCIFAKFYLGTDMFLGMPGIVDTLGPMPKQWRDMVRVTEERFYDQSKAVDTKAELERRINCAAPDIDEIERSHVVSIMMKGFRYTPKERITATQLLRDPSFQELIKLYT